MGPSLCLTFNTVAGFRPRIEYGAGFWRGQAPGEWGAGMTSMRRRRRGRRGLSRVRGVGGEGDGGRRCRRPAAAQEGVTLTSGEVTLTPALSRQGERGKSRAGEGGNGCPPATSPTGGRTRGSAPTAGHARIPLTPRIEYGAGSAASSGQALRGNHPCRLRPAHQGMKLAPPPPVRVDDSNRGLDTGPVSSTGQAFRRYDDVGVSPLFWYQRRVSCGRVGVTRGVSGRGVWSRLVRPRGPARASAV